MSDFCMPALGADMEQATLVEWRVAVGAKVKKGDIMAVVETHKGAIEIEVFEDGAVRELVAPVGAVLPVGALMARLDSSGASPMLPGKQVAAVPAPVAPTSNILAAVAPSVAAPVRATPAARRRAAELGLSIESVCGTGDEGAITFADVEAAGAQEFQAAPGPKRGGFDPQEMRRAIGAAMSRSKREIPHYYLGSTIDLGRALNWLDGYNQERSPSERMLPAVLLLKGVARALTEVPQLNGFWRDGHFRQGAGIHIGWAISLRGGGLIAPALRAVDHAPVGVLMEQLKDLVARSRNGGLRGSELTDPTITVSSLGDRGADRLWPVIYPPQVAIVGFGRIALRPLVVENKVEARPSVEVSLAADHRASDGHVGGLFLAALERRLQEPEAL